MGGPDPYRDKRNLFNKRSKTLARKAKQLAKLSGARVYLLIMHERASIVYNSNCEKDFPPPDNTLDDLGTFTRLSPDFDDSREPTRLVEQFFMRRATAKRKHVVPEPPNLLQLQSETREAGQDCKPVDSQGAHATQNEDLMLDERNRRKPDDKGPSNTNGPPGSSGGPAPGDRTKHRGTLYDAVNDKITYRTL